MDGTLTEALHDFPAIKRELGLPLDLDILSGLNLLEGLAKQQKTQRLNEIEMEIAGKAKAAPGVLSLLNHLKEKQIQMGILTRNNHENTLATLQKAELLSFFSKEHILTRDHALPKPDPEGLLKLQNMWSCEGKEMLMIGDYLYDLLAGKAALTETVYIDPTGEFKFKEHATYSITQMDHILNFDLL